MKAIVGLAVAATLAITGVAQPHNHGHNHIKRQPTRTLPKRANQVEVVVDATVTVWEVAGEGTIDEDEAKKGIQKGEYIIVGESDVNSSTKPGGVFKEDTEEEEEEEVFSAASVPSSSSTSSSSSAPPTSSSTTVPSSTSSASAEPTTVPASNSMLDYNGIDKEFPDGVLSCDSLPGGYGAVSASWLGMKGWLGVQWGFSSIRTGIKGNTCTSGAHCSYLCPEGYQKSQWPERQGDTLESIGGLYCNADGKLELTRPSVPTLCQKGKGGIFVKSKLTKTAFICRTDYPGTESMLIPIEVGPDGAEHEVTNPDQTWYTWNGKLTTAQYYINPAGLDRDDACVWDSAAIPDGAGDKAPTNFGTGMDNGITYFGLFPNSAVSSAVLEYNIKIYVDGKETCSLVDGVYSGSSTGCTGAAKEGQKVLIELY